MGFNLFDGIPAPLRQTSEAASGSKVLGDASVPKKSAPKGVADVSASASNASNFLQSLLGAVKVRATTTPAVEVKVTSGASASSGPRPKREKSTLSGGGKQHGGLLSGGGGGGGPPSSSRSGGGGGPGRYKQLVAWFLLSTCYVIHQEKR